MNHISPCCHEEIIVRTFVEYHDGGSRWGTNYKYDACSCCGNEVLEYVEVCETCGDMKCECLNVNEFEAKERWEIENFGLPFN